MRKIKCLTLILALFLGFQAQAEVPDVTVNGAITSHYVWRGISQSGKLPAAQAGLDWSIGSPFTFDVGTWGSSISYGKGVELDLYGGLTYHFNDDANVRLGFLHYTYFNVLNFYEIPLSFGFCDFSAGYAYDPKNKNGYASLGWGRELFSGISGALSGGYSHFKSASSYFDFKVGASKEVLSVTVDASVTFVTRNVDSTYFVATLSKSM